MPTSPRGSFKFFISGAEGISSVIRDQRRKGLRIASNTPPALSLSKVPNSRNSLPCPFTPRMNAGMASGSRDQRLRSGFHWTAADSFPPHRIRNHSQQARASPGGVTTENTNNRPGLKQAARIRDVDHGFDVAGSRILRL